MIKIYTDNGHDSETLIEIMHKNNVEFTDIDINSLEITILRYLTARIRENREIYGKMKGPSGKWTTSKLALPPIIETDTSVYPWWYTREKLDTIIREIKANQPDKKLRIIKSLNRTPLETKSGQINVDLATDARINVTVLRAINGIDITNIINTWPMGERAAALILWRTAQHQRSQELLMLADMITAKAKSYDPYQNNNEWINNEESWTD